MARLFDGTDDYLTGTLDLSVTAIVTVTFRLWWDTFASDGDLALEYTNNPDGAFKGFTILPNHGGSSNFLCGMTGSGASTFWTDTFPRPSAAAWHLYTFVFDRTNRVNKAWVDGVSQSLTIDSHNGGFSTSAFDATSLVLNAMTRGGTTRFGAGRMAEIAIWDVELSSGNLTLLHAGGRPSNIDVGNLLFYAPVCGATAPEPSQIGSSLTVNGAVFTAHPIANSICDRGSFARIYGPGLLPTSAATLFTTPTGCRDEIDHIRLVNNLSSAVNVTLSIGADAAATRIWDSKTIAADATVSIKGPFTLEAGEFIQGFQDVSNAVAISMYGWRNCL